MERELYSKIELGTDDVRYLRDELLRAGNDKLALHLPSSEEDPLKARVNEHVRGFINKIFEMGRYSMVVDGEDMSERESLVKVLDDREEKIEPFDSDLNAKLRQVYDQVDKKTLEVSNLRRTVPKMVVDEYSNGADANRALTDDKSDDNDDENKLNEQEWMDLNDGDMAETRQTYYEALETLNRMKDAVPTSEAELKNLQSVINHLREPSRVTD
uniref:ARAD1B13398p n=1 Tax=Blastobotrys adeninivorans TaxID=409370 RepID=A0A060TB69_BLAAD